MGATMRRMGPPLPRVTMTSPRLSDFIFNWGEIFFRRSRIFAARADSYPGTAGVSTKSRITVLSKPLLEEVPCAEEDGAMYTSVRTINKKISRLIMKDCFSFGCVDILL